MSISYEVGTIDDVLAISSKIIEFKQVPTFKNISERLQGKKSLILIARYKGELAGYKVGYKLTDTEFYS